MKHNFMTKMVSALLAVVLSTAAFSVTAFASGGEESTESVAEQETAGDVSDLLSALAGSQVTVSVTEDGIQFSSGENDSGQTGTVTTGGGNLNVRTGAGMDYTAFTQLPNGTTVKVIGTDGDWLKVILPEKVGYVYSGYMTVSDGEAGSGEGSFSLDAETLENLLGMLGGGLNGGAALTPDGNLSLIDDIGSPTASGKQFITVETKNGNVFYLIIDRDDEGEETVHFLNQVDEADLMALTEDGEKAETPIVCTCTEKCQAGAVNTACPVCVKNLSECVGTEQKAAEPTEPENPEPEKKSNTGAILAVLLILAAGGGAAVYFLVLKPKQGKKVPADLDDFDLKDEEYLTEDMGNKAAKLLAPLLAQMDIKQIQWNVPSPEFYAFTPEWGLLDDQNVKLRESLIRTAEQVLKKTEGSQRDNLQRFIAMFRFELLLGEVDKAMMPAFILKKNDRQGVAASSFEEYEEAYRSLMAAPVKDMFETYMQRVHSRGELGVLSSLNQRLWREYNDLKSYLETKLKR